jgi:hypothetical protein
MVRLGALLRKPHDAIYALTLPFRDFSFVPRVECEERGRTGVREAVVLAEFLKVGSDDMDGWAADLYDPSLRTEPLRNISEDEKYDAKFPDHSLSRVARYVICIPLSSWPPK